MRFGLLTTAVAFVALGGVAQAGTITETFAGTILAGDNNDHYFGVSGPSLAGTAITISFSYDTGLLQADAATGAGRELGAPPSGYELQPSFYEQYDDNIGDSAVTESVTINSITTTWTNNAVYGIGGYGQGLQGIVTGCVVASCVQPSATGGLFRIGIFGYQSDLEFELNTDQNYSIGDILSQSAMDTLLGSAPITGRVSFYTGIPIYADNLLIGVESTTISQSAAPEPVTLIPLALGLGLIGLRKRRAFPVNPHPK